jgi:hypothetical protein
VIAVTATMATFDAQIGRVLAGQTYEVDDDKADRWLRTEIAVVAHPQIYPQHCAGCEAAFASLPPPPSASSPQIKELTYHWHLRSAIGAIDASRERLAAALLGEATPAHTTPAPLVSTQHQPKHVRVRARPQPVPRQYHCRACRKTIPHPGSGPSLCAPCLERQLRPMRDSEDEDGPVRDATLTGSPTTYWNRRGESVTYGRILRHKGAE